MAFVSAGRFVPLGQTEIPLDGTPVNLGFGRASTVVITAPRAQRLGGRRVGLRSADALRACETAGRPTGSVSRATPGRWATDPSSAGAAAACARFTSALGGDAPALGGDAPAPVFERLAQAAAQV